MSCGVEQMLLSAQSALAQTKRTVEGLSQWSKKNTTRQWWEALQAFQEKRVALLKEFHAKWEQEDTAWQATRDAILKQERTPTGT